MLMRSALLGRPPASTTTSCPSLRPLLPPSFHRRSPRCNNHITTSTSTCTLMDPSMERLIQSMHANPTKAVIYVTGGAVQALSWLLSVPGASNTVIEASVPYARESLMSVLGGHEPKQYCSEDTAVQIATAAYRRAAALTPDFATSFVGVGATCALASVPPKRGEHRAFLAVHIGSGSRTLSITFAKGERTRVGEDDLASRALVKLLADCMGVDSAGAALPLITESVAGKPVDVVQAGEQPLGDPILALLQGRVRCVEYGPGGRVAVDAPRTHRFVLPGSFNPLHQGHTELLDVAVAQHEAKRAAGGGGEPMAGCFELTIGNADKGFLAEEEIRRRVAQFTSRDLPLVLTNAPLFTSKAELLKDCTFVLGYDTAVRIVMPKYYNNSFASMLLDFSRLRAAGCRFLVAGRRDGGGVFRGLEDAKVPPELADLFEGLSEDEFRVDVSSTELRRQQQEQWEKEGQQQQTSTAAV